MTRKKPTNDADHLAVSRFAVELARRAPELVPALLWLVATGSQSEQVKAFRRARPTPEELAGLTAFGDGLAREILEHRRTILKKVDRVEDPSSVDLVEIRGRALQRLGFGLESVVFSMEIETDSTPGAAASGKGLSPARRRRRS